MPVKFDDIKVCKGSQCDRIQRECNSLKLVGQNEVAAILVGQYSYIYNRPTQTIEYVQDDDSQTERKIFYNIINVRHKRHT